MLQSFFGCGASWREILDGLVKAGASLRLFIKDIETYGIVKITARDSTLLIILLLLWCLKIMNTMRMSDEAIVTAAKIIGAVDEV
jgi:hypothetical protein